MMGVFHRRVKRAFTAFGLLLPSVLFAGTPVSFTAADLAAVATLVHPEKSSLRLDGRRGVFRPAPSLDFLGIPVREFEVNLDLSATLVDLRFHELRAKANSVAFDEGTIRLEIPFEDQEGAIRSRLGQISIKDVVLVAWLRIVPSRGPPRIEYDHGTMRGELRGTGLLKPKWVLDEVRKIAMRATQREIDRLISRPEFNLALEKGLVTWSRFSIDERLSSYVPGTVKITSSGLRYEAE